MIGATDAIVLLASYLVGATPFGYLAGKMRGIDIRDHGSGNIGATNVLRVLGKPVGITVFLLDFLKGLVPVLVAKYLSDGNTAEAGQSLAPILAALGAILGHNFTFWLKFRGGKGVATSAGALIALLPIAVACGLAVWILLFFGTRYVAVASMGAALTIPVVTAITDWGHTPLLVFSIAIAVLAVVRHRANIRRLLAGNENRFQRKAKPPQPDS